MIRWWSEYALQSLSYRANSKFGRKFSSGDLTNLANEFFPLQTERPRYLTKAERSEGIKQNPTSSRKPQRAESRISNRTTKIVKPLPRLPSPRSPSPNSSSARYSSQRPLHPSLTAVASSSKSPLHQLDLTGVPPLPSRPSASVTSSFRYSPYPSAPRPSSSNVAAQSNSNSPSLGIAASTSPAQVDATPHVYGLTVEGATRDDLPELHHCISWYAFLPIKTRNHYLLI